MGLSVISTDMLLTDNSMYLFLLFYIFNIELEFIRYLYIILRII